MQVSWTIVCCLCLTGTSLFGQTSDWLTDLKQQLPLLGHRNWIVVADSAYPSQTAPGIKTIYTGEKQIEAVKKVLAALDQVQHVRGTVLVDSELEYVPEKFAPGIDDYRAALKRELSQQNVTAMPHEEIIKQLDEAGQTFHVIVLKTDMTLPYTSVFIRLDCGYWSDDAEKALRNAINAARQSEK